MTSRRHEFTAEETADLLDELDARLRRRGVAASIFMVGGAAIAANHIRRDRVTEDVDALTRDTAVLEEATGAGPGARSAGGLVEPERRHVDACRCPGESSTSRPNLASGSPTPTTDSCWPPSSSRNVPKTPTTSWHSPAASGSRPPAPRAARSAHPQLLHRPRTLEFIVDGPDVDREISLLAHDASRMLHRAGLAAVGDVDPTQPGEDPQPSGLGGASRARNALPGPHVTPRAAAPPGSADNGSCLERSVRGLPSSPRTHARRRSAYEPSTVAI